LEWFDHVMRRGVYKVVRIAIKINVKEKRARKTEEETNKHNRG